MEHCGIDLHLKFGEVCALDEGGRDWELAVGLHPFPFLWFKVGYREAQVSAESVSGAAVGATDFTDSGYFGAVGVKF